MNAEVITVGTELLLGQILDTNSVYLSRKLAEIGVNLYYRTTVGDNKERLIEALHAAKNRAQLVIITGGLGPTVDDITRDVLSEFTGKKLTLDDKVLSKIEKRVLYPIQRMLKKRRTSLRLAPSLLWRQGLRCTTAIVMFKNPGQWRWWFLFWVVFSFQRYRAALCGRLVSAV